jgi:hypothetical protein
MRAAFAVVIAFCLAPAFAGSSEPSRQEIVRYDTTVVLSCMDLARQPSGNLEF